MEQGGETRAKSDPKAKSVDRTKRLESLGGQVEVGGQGAVWRLLVGHYAHRRASAGEGGRRHSRGRRLGWGSVLFTMRGQWTVSLW